MNETRTSLLRRVRDTADQRSWGEFKALYEPLLFSYVRKRGLRHDEASDVVQGIFITLIRKMPTFQLDHARGRFRTWLYQVASNAVVDWVRTQQRRKKGEDGWVAPTTPEGDEQEWDKTHEQRIMEFAMEQVKKKTVEKTWKCFEEHLLKERSGADVGKELGLPPNTVYVNASRVMARIKEECEFYRKDLGDE